MLIPIISFLYLDLSEFFFFIYFLFLYALLSVKTCKHATGTCFMKVLVWYGAHNMYEKQL
jgi:hypothetical protein